MSLYKVAATIGLTFMQASRISSQNCNGCADESSCVNLVDDAVYGCYGTFGAPIFDDALNRCKRGQGYHMCESANEADLLGLTIGDCQNKVPAGHHFWSLESSVAVDDGSNEGQCYSKNGPVTYNDRPRDDVYGCASSQTDISICGNIQYTTCGPFNKGCDAHTSDEYQGLRNEDGVELCPCEDIELFTFAVTDASVGGVVCCSDTIPTGMCHDYFSSFLFLFPI